MAKSMKLAAVVATALCLSSLLGTAFADVDANTVEGQVFCDTCRLKYRTKLIEFIEGAEVSLECFDTEGGKRTYMRTAVTDETGTFSIPVEGSQGKVCKISAVRSPREDCNEIVEGLSSAHIDLSPSHSPELTRYASDVAFMKKDAIAGCDKALVDMFEQ